MKVEPNKLNAIPCQPRFAATLIGQGIDCVFAAQILGADVFSLSIKLSGDCALQTIFGGRYSQMAIRGDARCHGIRQPKIVKSKVLTEIHGVG